MLLPRCRSILHIDEYQYGFSTKSSPALSPHGLYALATIFMKEQSRSEAARFEGLEKDFYPNRAK